MVGIIYSLIKKKKPCPDTDGENGTISLTLEQSNAIIVLLF